MEDFPPHHNSQMLASLQPWLHARKRIACQGRQCLPAVRLCLWSVIAYLFGTYNVVCTLGCNGRCKYQSGLAVWHLKHAICHFMILPVFVFRCSCKCACRRQALSLILFLLSPGLQIQRRRMGRFSKADKSLLLNLLLMII